LIEPATVLGFPGFLEHPSDPKRARSRRALRVPQRTDDDLGEMFEEYLPENEG
jgi:hypothetical protein